MSVLGCSNVEIKEAADCQPAAISTITISFKVYESGIVEVNEKHYGDLVNINTHDKMMSGKRPNGHIEHILWK